MQAKSRRELAVSAIVAYELESGARKSANATKALSVLSTFLNEVVILPFDYSQAQAAAEIRRNLESIGQPIGPHDVLIAGCAMVTNRILVTNNTKEFSRVNGLLIEDWV